jgi:hypothetical protein
MIDLPRLAASTSEWFEARKRRSQLFGEAALVLAIGESLPEEIDVAVEVDFRSINEGSAPAGYFNYDLLLSTNNARFLFEMKFLKASSYNNELVNIAYERVVDDIIKLAASVGTNLRCFFIIARPVGTHLPSKVQTLLDLPAIRPVLDSEMLVSVSEPKNVVRPSKRLISSVDKLREFIDPLPTIHIRNCAEAGADNSTVISIYEIERS